MKHTLKRVCTSILALIVLIPNMLVSAWAASSCTVGGVELTYESTATPTEIASEDMINRKYQSTNGSASATWDASNNRFVLSATNSTYYTGKVAIVFTAEYQAQNYSGTLTLSNNTESTVKMQYTVSGTVDSHDVGTYKATLHPGQSIKFTLSSKETDPKQEDAITYTGYVKIDSLYALETVDVSFASSSRGGYTYQVSGGDQVTLAKDGTTSASQTLNWGTEVTLTQGTPDAGYAFYGWMAGNELLGTADGTYAIRDDAVVYPVYLPEAELAETAPFKVGENTYRLWTPAFYDAQNSGNTVVLNRDYTLPTALEDAGLCAAHTSSDYVSATDTGVTYKIPFGTTLLVPYDSEHTLYKANPALVIDGAAVVAPTAYTTLTMAQGTHLTVAGDMSLSGKVHAYMGGLYQNSAPTGPSGFVQTEEGSSITIANSGKLYAWGYIVGSGEVIANSGGTIYECFQIRDWRGGDATNSMKDNDKRVFPVSQYYVQNIEVPLTLKYGAKEKGFLATYVSKMQKTAEFTFIGSDGMFRLADANSTVTKKYDGATDRLLVDVNGNISMDRISISIATGIIGSVTLDSSKYVLPINSNITVSVHEGSNVTVGQDLAMLPGSVIEIDEGANLTLSEGKNIFVYDRDSWGAYCVGGVKFRPVCWGYSKNYTRKDADLVDAKIIVNGYVDASAGKVYTTTGGANICSTGKGSIKLADTTDTTTYQATQTGTDISYNEISATPAKLTNAQGDPTSTGTAGTYYYDHDKWILGEHTVTSDVTNPTCTAKGYTTHTCSCGYSNVDTYVDPLPHTYVPGEYKWSEDGKSCTVTGTCSCGANATATATITSAVNTPATCEDMGWTTYTATFSETWAATQTMDVKDISSLGHDHNGKWMSDGSNHYKICARQDCEKVLDMAEHSGGTATCVAAKVCDTCDLSYGTVDEKAHTPAETVVENEVPASCGVAGSYDSVVYCSVEGCRKELSREKKTIDATGEHTGGEATCKTKAVCTVCQQPYGEIDSGNHKNTELRGKQEATEFEAGYTGDTYCNDCEKIVVEGEVIPATHQHSFGEEWTSDATGHWHECVCEEKSEFAQHTSGGAATEDSAEICTVCKYEIAPKLEHVHVLTKVEAAEATCVANGNIEHYKCSGCGKLFSDVNGEKAVTNIVIPAIGHTYDEPEWDWSGNDTDGYTAATATFTCEKGDDTQTVSAEVNSENFEATETEKAKTVYTATVTVDENTYTATKTVEVAEHKHSYEEAITKAATCGEDGIKTFTCECGDSYTEVIPATGEHNYVDGVCDVCGDQELNKITPMITAKSLMLEGMVSVNVYLGFVDADGNNLDKAYVLENAGLEVVCVDGTIVYNTELKEAGAYAGINEYTVTTPGIPAKDMDKDLVLRAYIEVDGSKIYGEPQSYGVMTYVNNTIPRANTTEKLKKTLIGLLNYGTAAQKYFDGKNGYKAPDVLMNVCLNGYVDAGYLQKEWLELNWDGTLLTALNQPSESMIINFKQSASNYACTGKSLVLNGAVSINYYMSVGKDAIIAEKFKGTAAKLYQWTGAEYEKLLAKGEVLTKENATYTTVVENVALKDDGYGYECTVESGQIAAKEFGDTFYAVMCFVDNDGNEYFTNMVVYSPEEYATKYHTGSNTLAGLVQWMVTYGEYAKINFTK